VFISDHILCAQAWTFPEINCEQIKQSETFSISSNILIAFFHYSILAVFRHDVNCKELFILLYSNTTALVSTCSDPIGSFNLINLLGVNLFMHI